jgi:adenylate kinase family enzyme
MQRIVVLGSGGAGKSTFSVRVARETGLPLVHLDALYWKPGWVESSKSEWAATVEEIVRGEQWIVDGNYGGTLEQRLAACDTVIFLDVPRHQCLWRVIKRRLRYRGRSRPDMREGCNERLTLAFLLWIWRYPETRKPLVLKRLREISPARSVIVLNSASAIENFTLTSFHLPGA